MNLQKERESDGGVSTASPMIKLAKRMEKMEKMKKKACVVRIVYLSLVGRFCFILEFLFDSWKNNLVISAVESLLPRPILLDFWKDNIINLVIKFDFPYQISILPYLRLLF